MNMSTQDLKGKDVETDPAAIDLAEVCNFGEECISRVHKIQSRLAASLMFEGLENCKNILGTSPAENPQGPNGEPAPIQAASTGGLNDTTTPPAAALHIRAAFWLT